MQREMGKRELAMSSSLNHSQSEMGRGIAGCRGRLRRSRSTRKIEERATTSSLRREVLELSDAFECDVRAAGEPDAATVPSMKLNEDGEGGVLVGRGAEKETNT
jgi:hypothetical protein